MSFKVTVQPSGHQFDVDDDESVLDAAMRQNIELPYGCRGGACGACAGTVLAGSVYYDDEPFALDDAMKADNQALFCIAKLSSDIVIGAEELETLAQFKVKQFNCHVQSKEHLNHDVISLKLTLDNRDRLQFLAGQYIEFILDDDKRRAFSIANAPHNDELIELHIRHVDGGIFTDFLFESMQDNQSLKFQGPLGSFYLREDRARPIILMGGGTGFGPLKAIIEHIQHVKFDQPVHLFMGVRSLRDLYMNDMVKQWLSNIPNLKFIPVLSEATTDDNWPGEQGFVHQAVANHFENLADFDIYMSGPPVMINAAVDLFIQQHALKENMFSDAFEYSADATQAIGAKK